jgi:hypothetical protein
MRVALIPLVLVRLAVLLILVRAVMTNRASDRRSGDRVMPGQVAYYGAGRSAGKASCLCATGQAETNNQRND